MSPSKADIIAQLKNDILPLQGFRSAPGSLITDADLGQIKYAFPNDLFPTGAMHEFFCAGKEDEAATNGFITGILASLMHNNGASVWISSSQTLFPPGLKTFGIEPDKIIFVHLLKERDILWALEEALKCDGLSAVVGEIRELSFTASRRFQLAVEQSRVTGFIVRNNPRANNTTACIARWKITSLPGIATNDIPGVGFPGWNVELLKIRNGKPGNWQIEWAAGRFRHSHKLGLLQEEQQKKAG